MAIPQWFWVALLTFGACLFLIGQGINLTDLGIVLILIGGGKLVWDARRGRDRG